MEADTNLTPLCGIEESLKKNRAMDSKLNDATRVIQNRLESIRSRIHDINRKIGMPVNAFCKRDNDFDTKAIYESEWNDVNNPIGYPQNADTIAKHLQTKVPYHSKELSNYHTQLWTPLQDCTLRSVIHKLEVQDRVKEHSAKKYALRHMNSQNSGSLKMSRLKIEIAGFDLLALKKKSLEELVLNGKGTYDWNEVSNLMQHSHTAIECRVRWFQYLHPSVNTSEWTNEEDIRLVEIAERMEEQDWDEIAVQLDTGRSAYSCFTAYQSRLRGMDVRAAVPRQAHAERLGEIMDSESSWSRDDDCTLASAVTRSQSINGISWSQVMLEFPHKSRKQLFARWSQVLDPALRGGKLTLIEQRGIVIGTRRFGLSFAKIRNELIPHRTVSQLRHHTLHRINKCSGRGVWSLFSEQIFRAVIEYYGPGNWPEVGSYFPYNSPQQIKRRYRKQLESESYRHTTIYAVTKTMRAVPLSETDLETVRLIDHWESIKPLNHSGSTLPLSGLPGGRPVNPNGEVTSDESGDDGDGMGFEDQLRSAPSTSQQSPCDPLGEGTSAVPVQSYVIEDLSDSDESTEVSEPVRLQQRRGRPPSKKKKVVRTEPKRRYVRTGKFKIRMDENWRQSGT